MRNCNIAITGELDIWKQHWKIFKGDHPNYVIATIKTLIFPGFENIKAALRIHATLPVTFYECKRS